MFDGLMLILFIALAVLVAVAEPSTTGMYALLALCAAFYVVGTMR